LIEGEEFIMEWYLAVLKKYAVFGGRAGRKEFWIFYLINFVILIVLTFIESNINQPPWGSVSLIAGIYDHRIRSPRHYQESVNFLGGR
jgi:uncharacterized membrane protein YhaH (DUF805 family)